MKTTRSNSFAACRSRLRPEQRSTSPAVCPSMTPWRRSTHSPALRLNMGDVEVLVQRYAGRRDIRRARAALDLVDAGAESPQETRLRLLFIRAGFPRPETQIAIYDGYGQRVAVLDMGWRNLEIGADYEGEHHRLNRRVFNNDIRRHDAVTELGWIDLRVTVEDTDAVILDRMHRAFERRGASHLIGPPLST